jgi:hypothetical protein
MLWRLDLTDYTDVKMNAEVIWTQIGSVPPNMPPHPFPPFTPEQVATFKQWMNEDYPQ